MKILVVWEDTYFDALSPFVRRRLSSGVRSALGPPIHLAFHTANGSGNFVRYVRSTWPNIRARGLPSNAGPIDFLLCVADGDKIAPLLGLPAPPTDPLEVPLWHEQAEQQWQTHLRAHCDPSIDVSSVHAVVLRWAKESLVLAGFDQSAAKTILQVDVGGARVRAHLDRCSPSPFTGDAGVFTDRYRHPLNCINGIREASGLAALSKNAAEVDDALAALARDHLSAVCNRVPDIDRIVELIRRLSTPAAPAPLERAARTMAPRRRRKRTKRRAR